jgi:hypothetical protein
MKGIPTPDEISRAHLILAANGALLCAVHPNMREIDVEYDRENKKIIIFVYFDNTPTDAQVDDVGSISTEMSCQFPDEIKWEENIVVLPYPARISNKGVCIYRRFEPSPDIET